MRIWFGIGVMINSVYNIIATKPIGTCLTKIIINYSAEFRDEVWRGKSGVEDVIEQIQDAVANQMWSDIQ